VLMCQLAISAAPAASGPTFVALAALE
jgi:hypothetical protein